MWILGILGCFLAFKLGNWAFVLGIFGFWVILGCWVFVLGIFGLLGYLGDWFVCEFWGLVIVWFGELRLLGFWTLVLVGRLLCRVVLFGCWFGVIGWVILGLPRCFLGFGVRFELILCFGW